MPAADAPGSARPPSRHPADGELEPEYGEALATDPPGDIVIGPAISDLTALYAYRDAERWTEGRLLGYAAAADAADGTWILRMAGPVPRRRSREIGVTALTMPRGRNRPIADAFGSFPPPGGRPHPLEWAVVR